MVRASTCYQYISSSYNIHISIFYNQKFQVNGNGRIEGDEKSEERVEERIENLPGIQKSGPENHDSLTRALFELYLNRIELFMNYLNHPFYFFRCDGPCSTLFTEEVHHVGCKFVAGLSSSNVTHFTGRVLVSKRVLITGLQRMICDKKNVVGRREKEERMKEREEEEKKEGLKLKLVKGYSLPVTGNDL